jgi:hypothetical protein
MSVCYDQLTALLLLPPSVNLSRWGGRCQTRGERSKKIFCSSIEVGVCLQFTSLNTKVLHKDLQKTAAETIPNDNTDRSINDQSKQSSWNISCIRTWENSMNRLPPQVGVPWNRLLINQWPTGAFGLLHHSNQTGASIWHGHLWQTH